VAEDAKAAYETEVHFKSDDRAPLLIVGAEKDKTVPASLSRKQYEKYGKSDARTDYIEFPDRPHLMMVAEGWEEIGAGIEGRLDSVLTLSAAHHGDAET
jgi:alpha-beta hydrolase superfamily lysophospholipase